jgi:hypothetical protein
MTSEELELIQINKKKEELKKLMLINIQNNHRVNINIMFRIS